MANNFFSNLADKIQEEVWFQQIKEKWDALEPNEKLYVRLGLTGGTALTLIITLSLFAYSTRSLKNEAIEKSELAYFISQSNDEVKRLRLITGSTGPTLSASTPGSTPSPGTSSSPGQTVAAPPAGPPVWSTVFDAAVSGSGVDKSKVTISGEKPGATARELLFDITAQDISIKQVVKLAVQLENSQQPVKIRHMAIDTQGSQGAMTVKYAVSAFQSK